MKHLITILLFFFLTNNSFAQIEIDERDLLGKWNLTERTGYVDYGQGTSIFESIIFYDNYCRVRYNGDAMENQCDYMWFISNNNKLHLYFYGQIGAYLRNSQKAFVIVDFVKDQYFKLSSFHGYYSAVFTKEEDSSIPEIITDENDLNDATMYNLQGVKITEPRGIYIQGGKKKIAVPFIDDE